MRTSRAYGERSHRDQRYVDLLDTAIFSPGGPWRSSIPKQPGIVAREMFACLDGEGACLLDDFRAQFSEEAAAAVRLVHNCA